MWSVSCDLGLLHPDGDILPSRPIARIEDSSLAGRSPVVYVPALYYDKRREWSWSRNEVGQHRLVDTISSRRYTYVQTSLES
jgi:hypothetical protein